MSNDITFHVPVLLREVMSGLGVQRGGRYIDATIGGGGHTVEIVRHGAKVLGIDKDREAIEYTRDRIVREVPGSIEGTDWMLVLGNFCDIEDIARKAGFVGVDGVLFDLGVSSHQLDSPGRGFSYRFTDAPLDLRMNAESNGDTAAQLVNRLSQEELYDILATYGEEQLAGPIARAVVFARAVKPVVTVGDLVDIVRKVSRVPKQAEPVLSRVFQALRIAVNREFEVLKEGLGGAEKILAPGGRLAVITFHSLEDRITKQFMRKGNWRAITKKPKGPDRQEIAENRRARSAKLRISEKP